VIYRFSARKSAAATLIKATESFYESSTRRLDTSAKVCYNTAVPKQHRPHAPRGGIQLRESTMAITLIPQELALPQGVITHDANYVYPKMFTWRDKKGNKREMVGVILTPMLGWDTNVLFWAFGVEYGGLGAIRTLQHDKLFEWRDLTEVEREEFEVEHMIPRKEFEALCPRFLVKILGDLDQII